MTSPCFYFDSSLKNPERVSDACPGAHVSLSLAQQATTEYNNAVLYAHYSRLVLQTFRGNGPS
jgi:hypothetical protein